MTHQIILPDQVSDENGSPEAGAFLYTYEGGSTTPLTTYTDENLTTAHSNPIATDGEGRPPQAFTDGSVAVRVRITTSAGTLIDDYDPAALVGIGAAASGVSFSPVSGNTATNVQQAITLNTNQIVTLSNSTENIRSARLTGGTGNAYTITALQPITSYAGGQRFLLLIDRANTGAATLNVDNLGPISILKYDASQNLTALVAGDLAPSVLYNVLFNGAQFVVIDDVIANEAIPGLVQKSSSVENAAGTADDRFPTVAGVTEMIAREAGKDPVTSGTTHDFTGISNASEITIQMHGVSLSGSDHLLLQLSTGSTFATTGYVSTSSIGATPFPSTSGLIIALNGGSNVFTGLVQLSRIPGEDRWISSHSGSLSTSAAVSGGGELVLGGTLDGLRLTRSGSDTFNGGAWSIRYR